MTITSRQNPLVARFRDAARGDAGEMILLDGAHLVGEAIDAGISVHIAAVTPAASEKDDIRPLLAALARAGADIASVAAPVMDAISPVRSSSGIVALAERPPAADDRVYGAQPPLVVVAVDVQDPGNVGAIIRVAEAAGATGVVAAGASANPFGWKALRGSMGSGLRLPLASGPSPAAAVADAKRRGCRVIATAPRGHLAVRHRSVGADRRVDRRRRPGAGVASARRGRPTRDDPDAASGRIAQRRRSE